MSGRLDGPSDAVAIAAHEWASPLPMIRPHRIDFTARACSETGLAFDAAVLLTRFSLLLFAVDDLADGQWGDLDPDQRIELLNSCVASLRSPVPSASAGESGQLATLLRQAVAEMAAGPGGHHQPFVVRRFALMAAAMREEQNWCQRWQQGRSLPGFSAYLVNGIESSAMPTLLAALFLMTSPPEGSGQRVEEVLAAAGACCRLANDLQSHDREAGMGKPTSITILTRGSGVSEAAARRFIENEAAGAAALTRRLAGGLPTGYSQWARGAVALTDFSLDLYVRRGIG